MKSHDMNGSIPNEMIRLSPGSRPISFSIDPFRVTSLCFASRAARDLDEILADVFVIAAAADEGHMGETNACSVQVVPLVEP